MDGLGAARIDALQAGRIVSTGGGLCEGDGTLCDPTAARLSLLLRELWMVPVGSKLRAASDQPCMRGRIWVPSVARGVCDGRRGRSNEQDGEDGTDGYAARHEVASRASARSATRHPEPVRRTRTSNR